MKGKLLFLFASLLVLAGILPMCAAELRTFIDCKIISSRGNDGDSFLMQAGDTSFVVRPGPHRGTAGAGAQR
jgi:hypothetical protein